MLTYIKNARAIVTMDDADTILHDTGIYIDGHVIRHVGDAAEQAQAAHPADTVVDASGCFVYPGLINTHHHLYQTFTRNLPAVQNMELFPWLTALYEIWRGLDESCIYHSSLVGMGELLKYGCTTIMDHHYVFPRQGSDGFIDAQFRAASALGARFYATRGSMSRGKSDGGLPPDALVQDVDAILRDSERLVRAYHDAAPYSMRQMGLAPCSPFSVSTALLKESAVLARALGVRLHTHLCETSDEEQFCLELHGMRPLAYMQDCGWLGGDVWFAHGIHFNDEELQLLADTQTGVAHCPVSNMKLSSGVCRVPDMLRLGIPLGLAVDGSASNDGSNLLAELRACYLLHRLYYSSAAPSAHAVLRMATRGSARLLGRGDIGSLAPGMAADLFMIDSTLFELAGADADPISLLCTIGYARPVKLTMVNGRVVCRDGRLCGIDEERVRRDADTLVHKLVNA